MQILSFPLNYLNKLKEIVKIKLVEMSQFQVNNNYYLGVKIFDRIKYPSS